jgi:OpgC protein
MLAAAPLALLLLHAGRLRVVLLLSVGAWLLHQRFPESIAVPWPITNNDTFRIAAWQLWFFGGVVVGYYRTQIWERLRRLPRRPAVAGLGLLATGLLAVHVVSGTPVADPVDVPGRSASLELLFGKQDARPGRVLAFAVFFPLFYLALTHFWRPLDALTGWLLLPFGQNALYVYAVHLFAVYFGALLLPRVPGFDRSVAWQNTLVQLAVVLTIWLLVRRRVLFHVLPR